MKRIIILLIIACLMTSCTNQSEISNSELSDLSTEVFILKPPMLETSTIINSGIKLSWKAVDGAEYYSVLLSQNDGTWLLLKTTAYLQYTDKEVESNHNYTYTVICSSKEGEQLSDPSENVTLTYYKAPRIDKIIGSNSGVYLSWDEIEGIESYRILRKTAGEKWEVIGHSKEVSYTDETAKENTQYTYTVCCESKDFYEMLSGYSESGKTLKFLSTPIISSNGYAVDGTTIEWNPVDSAEKYCVFRKDDDGKWEKLETTTKTKYTDKNVENNKKYTYTVRCISSEGLYQSGFDSKGRTVLYLDAPVLKEVIQDEDDVLIIWEAVEGAEAYRIYRKPKDGKWEAIDSTTETRYWDEDLDIDTYLYTVRCVTTDNKTLRSGYYPGLEIELE